ncbi:MAG: complex I NDUFA9 subunit family protein [Alphaproteobacteria bacterium]|nr:complex I NDUFA9 subunit family protein [Alphaproteobacteria bacterium]
MAAGVITVFGGSGFIGRHIVQRLAQAGYRIRVPTRKPSLANHLMSSGKVGQIALMPADIRNEHDVAAAVAGADIVINLVGILKEGGGRTFGDMHADGAGLIARASAKAGVRRFVQVSAIGANKDSRSAYARSKAEGEAQVRAAFPGATILRPSIVFGQGDGFFPKFAALMRLSQFVFPLFGNGVTKFQPVFVGDVAAAVEQAIVNDATRGKTFELGGPAVYSFADLLTFIAGVTERKPFFMPIPFFLLDLMAALTGWLPFAPVTLDQARLLRVDNVVKAGADSAKVGTLADLGVQATALEAIVPSYLRAYRRTGQYAQPRGA